MLSKEDYTEEIGLIKKQNYVEVELYPLVADIIKPTLKDSLSKRYVFGRQRRGLGQIYYGLSNFPDIVILDKTYENKSRKSIKIEEWKELRGCVEVKNLNYSLITEEKIKSTISNSFEHITGEMGQLIGDLLWYKKVIYTNGIEWRFLSLDDKEEIDNTIVEVVNKRIETEEAGNSFDWWKNIKDLSFNYTDICLSKDCRREWNEFVKRVKEIEW
ncbi:MULTISPECIES: hypothetical protein [Streptococcus]|uniref:hypothetical protein n=1 Tax=Streptococcus TaxID=1301 RepID=UPI00021AFFE2|nr:MULTISPECIES: hypothetical protein [Streptococcus]AEL11001.1 hypothetical protein SPPN_07875 [Streptococcus pseudopneumoniae IS7493]EID29848.1 hypothetical protein HMPREF1046_1413 [Streptococcus pseudopneumoniae ATCC BAA-960 = CCUG 49455]KPL39059.1 hypothetical protein SPSSI2_11040 [Streptococcus pseudopneumoniae]KPL41365.1 hypothetical protein SPSSI1_06240 [Streptococcus pseudopneumoniae]MBF9635245.1 hypothetical protein [Streptococcus pseudopneumoniae]